MILKSNCLRNNHVDRFLGVFGLFLISIVIVILNPVWGQALEKEPASSIFSIQPLNTPTLPITPLFTQDDSLLSPEEAFVPTLFYNQADNKLTLSFTIDSDYYLYRDRIGIEVLNKGFTVDTIDFPDGLWHEDEFFGRQIIYDASIEIPLLLTGDMSSIQTLYLGVEAQGCAKIGICFPPTRWELTMSINPELTIKDEIKTLEEALVGTMPVAEHDRLTAYLLEKTYLAIPLFFALGLLLAFTPCVLPLLPILSGILTGRKVNTVYNGFMLSLIFVLGMTFVYVLLGLLAAFLGKGLAIYLQHAYVLIAFGLVFILLALSMFDLYTLQMPAKIQTYLSKISQQQEGKNGVLSLFVIGMLSALISGPCVTAPLIGVIGLIAQSQDYLLGGTILFSMSIGMGVPLLILGASSGHLLPKAGAWMNQIKALFGFILLGVAAYFIGKTIPYKWEQLLYAGLAFITALWFLVYIVKSRAYFSFFTLVVILSVTFGLYASVESTRVIELPPFEKIEGIKGFNEVVEAKGEQVMMLDFTADWCVDCKLMDKYVFSRKDVKALMEPMKLVTSDVTKNTQEDKRLLKHFGLYGPPAILFFDQQGKELEGFRILGSLSKEKFIDHLKLFYDHRGVPLPQAFKAIEANVSERSTN